MAAVTRSLDLLDLCQDFAQLSVVEVAATRATAVDTKRNSTGNKGREDCGRVHDEWCDVIMHGKQV